MQSTRREFRLTLTNVDRGVNLERTLILSRHPSETEDHLVLRVLAFALLPEESMTFGPGLSDGDAPDLVARDLIGKVTTWIECGDVGFERARKILQHNRDASLHIVFGSRERRDHFAAAVTAFGDRPPRGWERLSLWTFEEEFLARLAESERSRQIWTVTVTEDHLYVEVNGVPSETVVSRG